jgi:uncharacterized protein (DUF1778 family)
MPRESVRSERLEARIAPETLAIVKRAAELRGRSVSEFVVNAAQGAASKAIAETTIIHLSAEGQSAFAEARINPPKPRLV